MSDMIGLLRFGMPVSLAPVAHLGEVQTQKAAPEITAVAASSGGGQAAANYTATPRPAISPQFAYASAGEPVSGSGTSSLIALPEPFDPNVLTGPPPTFEATLLELEAHLRMSLARIDAARNVHAMDRPVSAEKPKSGVAKPEAGAAAGQKAETVVMGDTKPAPQPVPLIGRTPAPGGLRETGGSAAVAKGDVSAAGPAADAAPKAAAEPAAA